MTEQTKREFFRLVVVKETTRCWSWIGRYDADRRRIFHGQKAYRIMHQLRIAIVPASFHVHHKCENSSCVNPRHLVALSPDAHRAVHATKDKARKERIYRGEWDNHTGQESPLCSRIPYGVYIVGIDSYRTFAFCFCSGSFVVPLAHKRYGQHRHQWLLPRLQPGDEQTRFRHTDRLAHRIIPPVVWRISPFQGVTAFLQRSLKSERDRLKFFRDRTWINLSR